MAVSVDCELKDGYVLVRFRGQESYEDVHRFWEKLLLESEFKDHKRFLVVVEPVKRLDLYEAEKLCLDLAKMGRGKIIAYVDPCEKEFHKVVAGATIITNRGVNNKVFTSEEEASDWIRQYSGK